MKSRRNELKCPQFVIVPLRKFRDSFAGGNANSPCSASSLQTQDLAPPALAKILSLACCQDQGSTLSGRSLEADSGRQGQVPGLNLRALYRAERGIGVRAGGEVQRERRIRVTRVEVVERV